MTPQEAYNRGLDIAENEAFDKISNALNGEDSLPFNNPKMEKLRQDVLFLSRNGKSSDYVIDLLLGRDYDNSNLNSLDKIVIKLLEYIKFLAYRKSTSSISVKLKQLLTDLEIDFIKTNGKLK